MGITFLQWSQTTENRAVRVKLLAISQSSAEGIYSRTNIHCTFEFHAVH